MTCLDPVRLFQAQAFSDTQHSRKTQPRLRLVRFILYFDFDHVC